MTTVRLERQIEQKLELFSDLEKKSKSEIIKKALNEYFKQLAKKVRPYDLGKDLFGKKGSGNPDNSTNYKEKLKSKLHEKCSN